MPPQPENKALLAVIIWWGWHWGGGGVVPLDSHYPNIWLAHFHHPLPAVERFTFINQLPWKGLAVISADVILWLKMREVFYSKIWIESTFFPPDAGWWGVDPKDHNFHLSWKTTWNTILEVWFRWFAFSFQGDFFFRSSRSFSDGVTYILYHLPFFEDDFAIPQVGYVSSLDGIHPGDFTSPASSNNMTPLWKSPRIAPHTPQLGQKCWVSSTQVELK